MQIVCRLLVLLPLAVIAGAMFCAADCPADEIPAAEAKFFREEVFPLLKDSCLRCHGEKKQSSGLRLDSRDAVLKGGQNGPAIVVGKPGESLLMKVLKHDGDIQMPPDKKLDEEEIEIFKHWIEKNAPWPVEKKKG
ncbi:MAG: c-type cytochrome domain-containing protein [Planctomycetota bacterium]